MSNPQSEIRNPKLLYLDPFSGISGDMFVGALLDLGLDLAKLHHELSKLNLSGYHLSSRKVMRGDMSATKFDVTIGGVTEGAFDYNPGDAIADHSHSHSHEHSHSHDHGHEHSHSGDAAKNAQPRRNFGEIRELIQRSILSDTVKRNSIAAFEKLAQAEGRIHNMPPEKVHFHEVGALDSIVDMIGVCVALDLLGVDEIWCGPVALGGGFVKCDHGIMPVPAPATLELMKGIPTRHSPVEKELTTPTGAALVAALAKNFGPMPAIRVEKLGYGAGSREKQAVPNVLRVALGSIEQSPGADSANSDTVIEIRANIDDATPEVLGYVAETLLAQGALDVFFQPITMKKSRPATLLTIIAEPRQLDEFAGILFKETTTFGLRYQEQSRLKLARKIVSVPTPYGEVRVKVGAWQGREVNIHPEYEDCRAVAQQKKVPLQEVIRAARASYRTEK